MKRNRGKLVHLLGLSVRFIAHVLSLTTMAIGNKDIYDTQHVMLDRRGALIFFSH